MSWQERTERQWSPAGYVRIRRRCALAKRTGRIWSAKNAACKPSYGISVPRNCWLKELDWRLPIGKAEFLKKAGLQRTGQRNVPAIQTDVNGEGIVSWPDPCPRCGEDVGWDSLPARKSLLAPLLRYGYYRRCPICEKETEVEI